MTYEDSPDKVIIDLKNPDPPFMVRALRFLLRLLLTLITGAVLGGAIYFGARSFYRQAVLIPARTSILRMDDLSEDQSSFATQSAGEMEDLHLRISQLEKDRKADAEEISSLQAEVITLGDQMEQSQVSSTRLENLDKNLSAVATQSMKNGMDLDSFLSSSNSPVAELRQEIQLLRAMELLNRCRLYLSQNNYGLAAQDANLVRQIFLEMKNEGDVSDKSVIDVWIERLDLALTNLAIAPVVAGEDLEMVWRMVLVGLPEQGADIPSSGTIIPPETPWPAPTPTSWVTPTAVPTLLNPLPTPTPIK
ncbi:MAG: hypothetical protein AB9891_08300 [Anaerolineaceae bacterium]